MVDQRQSYTAGCCWFVLVYAFKPDLSECDRYCCKLQGQYNEMEHLDQQFCELCDGSGDDDRGCIAFYTQAVLPDSVGVSVMLLPKLFTGGGDSGT